MSAPVTRRQLRIQRKRQKRLNILTAACGFVTVGIVAVGAFQVSMPRDIDPATIIKADHTLELDLGDTSVESQSYRASILAKPQSLARSSYSATTDAEVAAIVEERAKAERAESARLASIAELKGQTNVPAIHNPLNGEVVFPLVDWNHNYPYNGFRTTERPDHEGIDMLTEVGTPIMAAHGGKVVFAGMSGGWGNVIFIETVINGVRIETRYAHQRDFAVQAGDTVVPGQTIGFVGMTGRTTAPHLHFEVLQDGALIDPAAWLEANAAK